ncbi:MAG TPA: hypothetical protein VL176_15630 [Steroidobacteraceae bacterium]|nr:hypothetical protein [Steroidobacteraceae bacterium]
MKRAILAFSAGLVVWIVVVSVLDRVLRVLLGGYAAAEPIMSFTLGMLVSRLLIAALTSLIAGAAAAWLAPASTRVPLLLGITLLVAFIPVHMRLWSLFPFWYHLVFLGTLLPLVLLGSRLPRMCTMAEARARS